MFYSDFGRACQTRVSRYILTFRGHFDEYTNSTFVRSVPLSAIPWC